MIETYIPVSFINQESEKEDSIRTGRPSSLHMWWSRRRMAAARSTLFASIVDDPSEHPDLFPTKEKQDKERIRLIELIKDLSRANCITNAKTLEAAKKEIKNNISGPLPTIFDPFAGGGSIPIEAHRLGLASEAADLNAVATLITIVGTDIPSRFSNAQPAHPNVSLKQYTGTQGFAEDVRFYGEWMLKEAKKRTGHLFPNVKTPTNDEINVSAWIWARTVRCPNPSCKCNIPLSSSYNLAKKKGCETWIEPVLDNGNVTFHLHTGPNTSNNNQSKIAQTAVFKCPACGEITPDSYVKECGVKHEIASQMIAIVAENKQKRIYLEPTSEHEKAVIVDKPNDIPHGLLPNYPTKFSPPSFGLIDYADLFTARQLIFITTMMDLARKVEKKIEKRSSRNKLGSDKTPFAYGGAGTKAYAQAIRTALVLSISKFLDQFSTLCSWNSTSGGTLRHVFSRAAIPMIWDYAEGNPFSNTGCGYLNTLHRFCDAITKLPAEGNAHSIVADSTMPNNVRNAIISTELPYYDKACYSELSDYFYIWIKYGLEDLYPEYFKSDLSLKEDELSSFSYRWNGDQQKANAIYVEALNSAFTNLFDSISDEYPSTVSYYYNHNKLNDSLALSKWESFLTAIYNAGFMITASWPLTPVSNESIDPDKLKDTPITVVIRKRPVDAQQTTRRSFVSEVKHELPKIIEEIAKVVDILALRPSIIGKALNIYYRYSKVLDAEGTETKPYIASRIIEQELDTLLKPIYTEYRKTNPSWEES